MYIEKTAYYLGVRSEEPNQALGKSLADDNNEAGIKEMIDHLYDKNKSLASDCLKVVYEASYHNPKLIVNYLETFIDLLNSKNNRMVWGAMIAISSIAGIAPSLVHPYKGLIKEKIETGTVITSVHGVQTLIKIAHDKDYYKEYIDELFDILKNTRPVDFPKRAELMISMLNPADHEQFTQIIYSREPELSNAGIKRIKKALKKL